MVFYEYTCTYLGEVVVVVMYSFFIILETCPRPASITWRTCHSIQNYYNGGLANLETQATAVV